MNAINPAWDPHAFTRPFPAPFARVGGPRFPTPPRGPRGRHGRRNEHGAMWAEARERSDGGPDREPGREPGREHRRGRHGRGPGGPGFGPGGPGFGPGGPGFGPGGPRRGGRRGRRTNRGDVRLAVLSLVGEEARHGYDIIREIEERSGGRWRPSPGSVYPTLSQLEDEGLVRAEESEGRRVVRLTEAGTTYLAEHSDEAEALWRTASEQSEEPDDALWQQLGLLHAAAQQVAATGTPEQVATATEALTTARKAIYRLLAE